MQEALQLADKRKKLHKDAANIRYTKKKTTKTLVSSGEARVYIQQTIRIPHSRMPLRQQPEKQN